MAAVSQLTIRVVVSRCIEKTILWTIAHQKDGGGSVEDLTKELVEAVRDELVKSDVLVQRKRQAIVRVTLPDGHPARSAARQLELVQSYLPANFTACESTGTTHGDVILIEGYDDHGWTLHEYVIPRLSSGLIVAKEVS